MHFAPTPMRAAASLMVSAGDANVLSSTGALLCRGLASVGTEYTHRNSTRRALCLAVPKGTERFAMKTLQASAVVTRGCSGAGSGAGDYTFGSPVQEPAFSDSSATRWASSQSAASVHLRENFRSSAPEAKTKLRRLPDVADTGSAPQGRSNSIARWTRLVSVSR